MFENSGTLDYNKLMKIDIFKTQKGNLIKFINLYCTGKKKSLTTHKQSFSILAINHRSHL